MYIPQINLIKDEEEAIEFMERFNFATLVSSDNSFSMASHLPFFIERKDDKVVLKAHLARVNEQVEFLENRHVLVIFSEPHAYISPKYYEKELNVPTWNYLAVHVYGIAKIIEEETKVYQLLEESIDYFDMNYKEQWSKLPMEYKLNLLKGIVAFEIEIKEIQGKKKLSQNKSAKEVENIINGLSKSENKQDVELAKFMSEELKKR